VSQPVSLPTLQPHSMLRSLPLNAPQRSLYQFFGHIYQAGVSTVVQITCASKNANVPGTKPDYIHINSGVLLCIARLGRGSSMSSWQMMRSECQTHFGFKPAVSRFVPMLLRTLVDDPSIVSEGCLLIDADIERRKRV